MPSGAAGFEHAPVAGLQVPAMWHWSSAVQITGIAPTHTPAWQVSDCVHALPSLHSKPSTFAVSTHWPVTESHAETWHWSLAVHVTPMQRSVGWHVPFFVLRPSQQARVGSDGA